MPPAATDAAGCVDTVKSTACVPPTTTLGLPVRFNPAVPVLRMVYDCTTVPPVTSAEPKSVWSVRLGVLSPSAMETELPWTSISGDAVPGTVNTRDTWLSDSFDSDTRLSGSTRKVSVCTPGVEVQVLYTIE